MSHEFCGFTVGIFRTSVTGLIALIEREDEDPLSPSVSGQDFDRSSSEGRAAVHDGDTDLDFGGLAVGIA